MKRIIDHPWDLDKNERFLLQAELATKVIREDKFDKIKYIVGVDVAYTRRDDRVSAAAVVLDEATLDIVEVKTIDSISSFPYIPGMFSFRELPPIIKALDKLTIIPNLIICDGNGIAHPQRFGIACHLGVLFDIPAIGCAKTRLLGKHGKVGANRGDFAPLIDRDEVVGNVLRTKYKADPVYVSPGHRISQESARGWILKLTRGQRLPVTTIFSDKYARQALKQS